MTPLLLLLSLGPDAHAEPPSYQIPPSVLAELRVLENRFELALSQDCNSQRCFSKGCAYVEHAVADKPRSGSLPGLGLDLGPGSVSPQEYLTQAQCSFAHEQGADNAAMGALARRLQTKLSTGWTTVSVGHQELPPLPAELLAPPEPQVDPDAAEAVEEAPPPPPEPEPWTLGAAAKELWSELLPHFWWMIGLGLMTLATVVIIWASRRVGAATIEEQALLAQLTQPGAPPAPEPVAVAAEVEASDDPAARAAAWEARLAGLDPNQPDRELQALLRELLRAGELPLLAKAVLRFPQLSGTFPTGGDVAAAKIELAEYLKDVDDAALPEDAQLFAALDRYALYAALVTQDDAGLVRSLREDFGPAGLASLIGELPARYGALVFALSPAQTWHELVRLLAARQVAAMSEQLLLSNRLEPAETTALFAALQAARSGEPLPAMPQRGVSDQGAAFDATGALSVLMGALDRPTRGTLVADALERFHGSLPTWTRGILWADMLFALSDEARADLLLSVDVKPLAAWLSLLDADLRGQLLSPLPDTLKRSIQAVSSFPSRLQQIQLAERGRQELARGFQTQLARARVPFERAIAPAAVS